MSFYSRHRKSSLDLSSISSAEEIKTLHHIITYNIKHAKHWDIISYSRQSIIYLDRRLKKMKALNFVHPIIHANDSIEGYSVLVNFEVLCENVWCAERLSKAEKRL